MQPIIAAKLISLTEGARHVDTCVRHMAKITANDAHRHDDICDTLYDAIKIALIDKTLLYNTKQDTTIAAKLMQKQKAVQKLKDAAYYGNQSR
jgi:hypothetical protein